MEDRRSLRNKLKARAYTLLAVVRAALDRTVTVKARDDLHQVTVVISPAGEECAPAADQGGLFFSPLEAAIVNSLDHTTFVLGKQLAKNASQKYTPKIKTLIGNLVQRRILQKSPVSRGNPGQGGYRLHPEFRSQKKSVS
jgi:hypothetical protein